ncbi:MAG: cytochrome c [Acidobacteria bacterium]|nr:cytochrome c [Acidobacteriota bacterium]
MNHEEHEGLEGIPGGRPHPLYLQAFVIFVAFVVSIVCVSLAVAASVWDGVYTEEQAKRGEAIYYQRCGACHGPSLEGGDMTPALVGGVFTSTWNDLALSELFERIRITMPLNQPSTLSRQQTADVLSFLLKQNKWPAGQAELPRELEPLKEIQIQAIKP